METQHAASLRQGFGYKEFGYIEFGYIKEYGSPGLVVLIASKNLFILTD